MILEWFRARSSFPLLGGVHACVVTLWLCSICHAQEDGWMELSEIQSRVEKSFTDPPQTTKLLDEGRVWIHRDEQAVIVDGYICQRNAPLEMFACPIGTKEHESIVAVFAKSQFVHAALLAVGGVPGKPVAFEPKFVPASGTTIRIYALWHDAEGKTQGTLAQNWIRQSGKERPMVWDWVFAGSKIYKDPDTGKESYLGNGGELVCVANFMTSTMDVAVKSDAANSGLVFEAFTDRIPKRNTPIRLVLVLSDESPYLGAEPSSVPAKPTTPTTKPASQEITHSDDTGANSDEAARPPHMTAPVSDRIHEFLPPRKTSSPRPSASPRRSGRRIQRSA
ncbi:MAG: YdjY domain-containing protein [Pirellula sp.]